MHRLLCACAAATVLAGCGGGGPQPAENAQVDLRNLAETQDTDTEMNDRRGGDLIATPSDTASRYYLLRTRNPPTGPNISIVRQDRGNRTVFARVETDCAARRLLIVGVGTTRGEVETDVATRAPLRTIDGLPLRQELATYICERAGTPI